jgi:SAM-dependent methyltransferase
MATMTPAQCRAFPDPACDDILSGVDAAFAPGEYVAQESFMRASEIRALAERAGIGPGVSVLDLCCGVGGPGRFITRELGCAYLGVDRNSDAIDTARERAAGLPCRFEVAQIPPVPAGPFDVVLLLETMLAFPDKQRLVQEISGALAPGGRFAFTLEEGAPLTAGERAIMPNADTVWLTPIDEMTAHLKRAGLAVVWQEDHSRAHRETANALANAYETTGPDDLLTSHRLWVQWLDSGRVRKLALVCSPSQ